jgi:hypothetical protein
VDWPDFVSLSGNPDKIVYENGMCYTLTDSGFIISEVSTPSAPQILKSYSLNFTAHQIAVKNGYAYLATSDSGVMVFDTRTPDSLKRIAQLPLHAWGVYAKDTMLLVSDSASLHIYNISDPASIREVGSLAVSGGQSGVCGDPLQSVAYLASGDFIAINYSNPAFPVQTGYLQGPTYLFATALNGRVYIRGNNYPGTFIYQNDIVTGVKQSRFNVPSRFSLAQSYPNPANPSARIRFEVPLKSRITLKLYDLLGREVQMLLNDSRSAGTYEITVNLNSLASGMYFYSLTAFPEGGGVPFVQAKKLVVLK